MSDSFFDPFFYGISVLVALLVFTDFILGKEAREKLKNKVGDWWVYLDDATYAGLGASDAARINSWFQKWLGPIGSIRFWVSAYIGSCLFLIIATFFVFALVEEGFIYSPWRHLVLLFDISKKIGVPIFVANTIMPVISLVITLGFLRVMASKNSLLFLILLTCADLVAALFLMEITGFIVQSHRTMDAFDFDNVFDQLIWFSGGLAALIPTIMHILLTTFFILSKLTAPILKRPVNLIVLRLHESQSGVLSLIGAALAMLAKLIQEGMKLS